MKNNKNLRIVNDILSIFLLVLALYITFSPFLPRLQTYYKQNTDKTKGYAYQSDLAIKNPTISSEALKPKPEISTLVIPSIGIDATIFEGESVDTLNKGVWRRPQTAFPGQNSNTVLVAHRFLYTQGTNTFYNLDKVKQGDEILVFYKDTVTGEITEHTYKVYETSVVDPTAIEIEDPTDEEILTLYTCTPIWTATHRLVVKAKPI